MQCTECGNALMANQKICPVCGAKQGYRATGVLSKVEVGQVNPNVNPNANLNANSVVVNSANAGSPGVLSGNMKSGILQSGEVFAGRFRIEKHLGLGSLCNAYLSRDLSSNNAEVVVKIIHARKATEAGMSDNFLFLAESVRQYTSKGIAKIYGSGIHEGMPYYFMEWISGIPLRLWLMERLNFENRVLPGLAIIKSLLDTFELIHERGCYGCLKPENIFITLQGPVVMDFGVVGFLSPQEFEFNSYARRYIPYMAPELRQDWSNLLPHSDYYSLGAILYEILVGRPPGMPLRLPSELSPIFGIETDEIILKAMAIKPSDRFGTLEAFKFAIESLQNILLHSSGKPSQSQISVEPAPVEKIPSNIQQPPIISAAWLQEPVAIVADKDEKLKDWNPPVVESKHLDSDPSQFFHPDMPPDRKPISKVGEDNGGRTVFFPSLAQQESEKNLSHLAHLGDKISEEANARKRVKKPIVSALSEAIEKKSDELFQAEDSAPQVRSDSMSVHGLGRKFEIENVIDGKTLQVEKKAKSIKPRRDNSFEAIYAAPPVPLWVWVLIAFSGAILLILSGYFGLMLSR